MGSEYDIAIIGGGVTGCAIARWLSRYKLKIILIEKHEDVASETTKANSGIIHGGYAAPEGSLRAEMNIKGNPMFDKAQQELGFEFERVGSFVVAVSEDQIHILEEEKKQGDRRGIPGEIITDIKSIKRMVPIITDKVVAVYHCPVAGIIWPFGLAIALAENAHDNGVDFLFSSPVKNIVKRDSDGKFEITAGDKVIVSKIVINAAGVFADEIAAMVGADNFKIIPRKGEYILLDKSALDLKKILFPVPTKFSKGILVCPTVHGNVFIGPNSNVQDDKEDTATTSEGLNEIIRGARKLVPNFPLRKAITNFAGLRAISSRGGDFIIEHSEVENFVNVAGICSPGLSSCLAIAERVVEILRKDVGIGLVEKEDYNPYRKPQRRLKDMSKEELAAAIRENPAWGRVICRCETVTEAEIVEAIHRPLGARSLDMIKKRLRPGMGRCQGAFCTPKVMKILSRELGIPVEKITKNDPGSELVVGRTKNLPSVVWEGRP